MTPLDWSILEHPQIGPIVERVAGKVARSRPLQDADEITQECRIVAAQESLELREWADNGKLGLIFNHLRWRLLNRLGPEDRYHLNVSLQTFDDDWTEYDETGVVRRQFDDLSVAGFRGGSGGGGE